MACRDRIPGIAEELDLLGDGQALNFGEKTLLGHVSNFGGASGHLQWLVGLGR
jgi:hypothetical protein